MLLRRPLSCVGSRDSCDDGRPRLSGGELLSAGRSFGNAGSRDVVDVSEFDTVTGMFAGRPSRRGLFGGLAGGVLAACHRASTGAQGVFLGPGEPWYDDGQ